MENTVRNLVAAVAISAASVYGGMKYEGYTIQQQTGLTKQNNVWMLKDKDAYIPVDKAVKVYDVTSKVRSALDELMDQK
jgi:hypothetical protein